MTPNLPEQAADLALDSQAKSIHARESERATNHSFVGRRKSQSRHREQESHLGTIGSFRGICSTADVMCISAPAAPCSCGKQGLQHRIPLLLVQLNPGIKLGPLRYQNHVGNTGSLKGRSHGKPGAPLQHAPTPPACALLSPMDNATL